MGSKPAHLCRLPAVLMAARSAAIPNPKFIDLFSRLLEAQYLYNLLDLWMSQYNKKNPTLEVQIRCLHQTNNPLRKKTPFISFSHPHNSEARLYDDAVEADMSHDTPALRRMGRNQARLPLRQLPPPPSSKPSLPASFGIHIHCFTDSPAFAQRLLDWFLNIGITGALSSLFASCVPAAPWFPRLPFVPGVRLACCCGWCGARATLMSTTSPRTSERRNSTSTTVRNMFSAPTSVLSTSKLAPASSPPNASETSEEAEDKKLRILETDAPYMVPAPVYAHPLFTSLVVREGAAAREGRRRRGEATAVPHGDGSVDGGVRRRVVGAIFLTCVGIRLEGAGDAGREWRGGRGRESRGGGRSGQVGRVPRHARRAGECKSGVRCLRRRVFSHAGGCAASLQRRYNS
ncbi:hypothetical protein MSAN_02455500 [Mycena sanguinolenta]|uniref:Uncharacterized protein n=1 Tax=Mycena sanguinolenta TaxID=230812 RepID=A0A8H6WY53_9AGAR|nr:hypothetical protein MSAN_02455500 [Mycena sanguinolenta]